MGLAGEQSVDESVQLARHVGVDIRSRPKKQVGLLVVQEELHTSVLMYRCRTLLSTP